jgi:tetratricopeptide (TPR) repeat protein
MRKLRLVPDNTHFRFMRLRRGIFATSIVLSVISIAIFIWIGPQYGIDFKGGTLIEMKPLSEATELAGVRSTLDGLQLGDVQVQEVSDLATGTNILVRIQAQEGVEAAQQAAIARVREALSEGMEFRRVEALSEWRRALEHEDDNATWHFRFGKLLAARRMNREALPHLLRAIELGEKRAPTPPWLWQVHQLAASTLGPTAAALPHWRKFLEQSPEDSPYRDEAKQALARAGQAWTGP